MFTDKELMENGVDALVEKLGLAETGRFFAQMNRERFDYTEWRRENLFQGMSINEISQKAAQQQRAVCSANGTQQRAACSANGTVCQRPAPRGMTLIELLVVTAIILLVVGLSVPALKPMLQSRDTKDAAESVRSYLLRARMRAMETGRPAGVMFERFSDSAPDSNAVLVLRQVEVPPPYCGMSQDRISVGSIGSPGNYSIDFWRWNSASGWTQSTAEKGYWDTMFASISNGDQCGKIQFNEQGPFYSLLKNTSFTPPYVIDNPAAGPTPITYPRNAAGTLCDNPATFKIHRKPRPTLTPPLGLPQGIVVDLNDSGIGDATGTARPFGNTFFANNANLLSVMFSPNGDVMTANGMPPDGLIYFLVGRWERIDDNLLPEDNKLNYQDETNYWVVVNPRTGNVSTAEMKPVAAAAPSSTDLNTSRNFASEGR